MKKSMAILCGVLLVFGVVGVASADLLQGLAAYYPFSGNPNDATGNGHNATLYGAVPTADRFGNPNSAYETTGNYSGGDGGNYIGLPDVIDGFGSLTLSLWVKEYSMGYPHGTSYVWFGAAMEDVVHISHWVMNMHEITFGIGKNSVSEGVHLPFDDNWVYTFQHYAMTYDGQSGILKAYQNGEKIGEYQKASGPIVTYGSHAGLGVHWGESGNQEYSARFNGVFDDVFIYDRALSDSAIMQLYSLPNPVAPVPEPATMLLLASGLAGLAGFRKRFRKR